MTTLATLSLLCLLALGDDPASDAPPGNDDDAPAEASPPPVEDREAEAEPPPTDAAAPPATAPESPAPRGPEPPAGEETTQGRPPATALEAAATAPGTLRIYTRGRVGAALLVGDGTLAVTLLELVRIGAPVDVRADSTTSTVGRVVALDEASGLALLRLEDALPGGGAPEDRPPMRDAVLGEEAAWSGHGGSPGLASYDIGVRALTEFSPIPTRVVAIPPAQREPDDLDDVLVDRPPGAGDRGAPLYGADGALLGLVDQEVEGGGGRARVIAARRISELLDGPPLTRPYRKRSHLQFWSGAGVAAHNKPSHLAATASIGFRVALFDHLRIEPWFEGLLGFRAASTEEDDDGEPLSSRPTDLWWSLETGVSVGYRVPIANDTSRDYIVPTIGFRVGWNKFQHRTETLAASCSDGPCRYVLERELDQIREVRPGVDLGVDVRHGKVRIGYRFFIDPSAVQAHSMHRVFVTIDGFPLPIAIGDTD